MSLKLYRFIVDEPVNSFLFLKIENIEPTEGMFGGRQAELQQFHHANLGLVQLLEINMGEWIGYGSKNKKRLILNYKSSFVKNIVFILHICLNWYFLKSVRLPKPEIKHLHNLF